MIVRASNLLLPATVQTHVALFRMPTHISAISHTTGYPPKSHFTDTWLSSARNPDGWIVDHQTYKASNPIPVAQGEHTIDMHY